MQDNADKTCRNSPSPDSNEETAGTRQTKGGPEAAFVGNAVRKGQRCALSL